MGRVMDFVRTLFSLRRAIPPESPEELRINFKARYHQFKLLLSANNKALEIMAEIEEALKGTWPFGMTFVRSRCTAVSTNVFQIARHLMELAPGRYETLLDRFKEIQQKINPFLAGKDIAHTGPLVVPLDEVDKSVADLVGSKMASLGEIRRHLGLKVPSGFVVTAHGYERFMGYSDLQPEIDRRIQAADTGRMDQVFSLSASIQQLIMGSPFPPDLEDAIREHYRLLAEREGRGVTLAMRSSALGEDLPGTSFAGQYRSELNVSEESLLDAYRGVVASKYSLPAMTYRLNRGIRDEEVAMCVGCIHMVDAVCGGVAYSRNPVDIRDNAIVINAVWGLPKSVVDGIAAADLFIVSRGDPMVIRHKEIPRKEQKFVCYPDEGVCRMDLTGDEGISPSLTDQQALDLARTSAQIEAYYGTPQDIEWAVSRDGSVLILQCRPLQQKAPSSGGGRGERDRGKVLLRGGVTASPGVAAGPVFILKKDADALQFPEGGILAVSQALPRWATLLSRAAAVISEQGGVAGHLANVAREFGVPALFGLEAALTRIRPGQVITVDADGLRIYDGRIEELLETKGQDGKGLMQGSPVFKALEGAAGHIVPLHLLDPDAPSFRMERCRTFHDITRFCHEKSVQEMFRFGKEHHFEERSSKQLLCEVPMQWWVLNLDDGFKDEVEGRFVKIENIASIPMLAIWEGIIAKSWEGPPPVDGKGLMSVMFEATRNTALVPGVRSGYGNRNYFMISRHYCSLTSRLGFHFSTVESLVSERTPENYVRFIFKGGAADLDRRQRRVFFVKEILDEHGFRSDIREDSLIARLEHLDIGVMKQRLKILGFLTIHTRQLDMIMSNPASYLHYRNKLIQEIQELVSATGANISL